MRRHCVAKESNAPVVVTGTCRPASRDIVMAGRAIAARHHRRARQLNDLLSKHRNGY